MIARNIFANLGLVLFFAFVQGCQKSDWLARLDIQGIRQPPTVSAEEANLPADKLIIGVIVEGAARAYRLDAFGMPVGHRLTRGVNDKRLRDLGRHVVNDVVRGVAVTVTHCDQTSCTRVFSTEQGEAIDMEVGGWDQERMLLKLDGKYFRQDSLDAPVSPYGYVITSWGEWKTLHPETDIYLGQDAVGE